jgi:hypothetical protein
LAKKAINIITMWTFESIIANFTWCILSSFMQTMLQMSNVLQQ